MNDIKHEVRRKTNFTTFYNCFVCSQLTNQQKNYKYGIVPVSLMFKVICEKQLNENLSSVFSYVINVAVGCVNDRTPFKALLYSTIVVSTFGSLFFFSGTCCNEDQN